MMRGAAPVSAGASGELERLIAAIAARRRRARAARRPTAIPARSLAELRALDGEVGAATSEYLDLVGCRLLDGFDISGRYALELPDALLRAIRSSVDGDGTDDGDEVDERIAAHPRAGARGAPRASSTSCSARRGSCTGCATSAASSATSGRRGSCAAPRSAAGRRLADDGARPRRRALRRRRLRRDVRAASRRRGGPSADELAERARPTARRCTAKDAPPSLGPPPPPPPDPSGLPPGVGAGDAARWASRWASCSAAPRPSTRRTCSAGSRRAAACYEGPGAPRRRAGRVRPDRRRATCSSPSRRPRRSTSCCRCSARSSPTAAACCRTRRSSRASTGSRRRRHPRGDRAASPTARASGSTATPAR